MTASLASGTTSSASRPLACGLATALLALACLCAAAPAAHAAGARLADARAQHAPPHAHATRHRARHRTRHKARHRVRRTSCAPAAGLLRTRRSVLRSQHRLLCLMNRARARFGLPRLRTNRCLHRVASRHAHDMVNRHYFAHTTPNGWDPGRRARASGYVPRAAAWLVGENIAWGVAGAARPRWVMHAWMHSPPHRRNLLNPHFRDVGIGVARGIPVGGFRRLRLRATFSVELGTHHGHTRCG